MDITQFRQQYPQYNHVDDETLTKTLHEKYYSGTLYEAFRASFNPKYQHTEEEKAAFKAQHTPQDGGPTSSISAVPTGARWGRAPLKDRLKDGLKGAAYTVARLGQGLLPVELINSAVNIEARKLEQRLGYTPGTLGVGNIEEALRGGLDYEPGIVSKTAGGVAENIGMLAPANRLLKGSKAAKWLTSGAKWGVGSSIREVRRWLATHIDPDTDYGYGGASNIAYDTTLGSVLGAIDGIPVKGMVGKALKETGISSLFAGIAWASGAGTEEIIAAAVTPVVLKRIPTLTNAVQRQYHKSQLNRIARDARMEAERKGLDTSKIPDEAFGRLASNLLDYRWWANQLKKGKITQEVFDQRAESIYNEASTVMGAMARQANVRKPATEAKTKPDIVYAKTLGQPNTGPSDTPNRPAPKASPPAEQPTAQEVLDKAFIKGLGAKFTAIEYAADAARIKPPLGKKLKHRDIKKRSLKIMKDEFEEIKKSYDGIQDVLRDYGNLVPELQEINKLIPTYGQAIDNFRRSPNDENFKYVHGIGQQIAKLGRTWRERMESLIVQEQATAAEIKRTELAALDSLRNQYKHQRMLRYQHLSDRAQGEAEAQQMPAPAESPVTEWGAVPPPAQRPARTPTMDEIEAFMRGPTIQTKAELEQGYLMGDPVAISDLHNEVYKGGKNEILAIIKSPENQALPTYNELVEIVLGAGDYPVDSVQVERPPTPSGLKKPLDKLSDTELRKRLRTATPYFQAYKQELQWRQAQKRHKKRPVPTITPQQAQYMLDSGQWRLELPSKFSYLVAPVEKPVESQQVSLDYKQSTANAERSANIAVVHKLARDLGYDDTAKRNAYEAITGKRSLKKMSDEELLAVRNSFYEQAKNTSPFYNKPPWYRVFAPNDYSAHKMGVGEIVDAVAEGWSKYQRHYAETIKEFQTKLKELKKSGHPVQAKELLYLLNQYENPPEFLDGKAAEVFQWYRDLTNDILQQTNAAREARGEEPIPHRDAYIKKVLIPGIAEGMLDGRYNLPKHLDFVNKFRGVNKVFNPADRQRHVEDGLGEIFSDDIVYVTSAMLKHSLKDIYLGDVTKVANAILQDKPETLDGMTLPTKLQAQVDHAAEMPRQTREWLQNFFNHLVHEKQTKVDEIFNEVVKGALTPVEKLLNTIGKTLGERPATDFFALLNKGVINNLLGFRPKMGRTLIRNKAQLTQSAVLYGTKAVARALAGFHPDVLKELESQSTYIADYQHNPSPDVGKRGKFTQMNLAPFHWTGRTNAVTGARTAFYGTLDLFTNPKYQKFGWASPQRTYEEPKYFLYDDEKVTMLREMEWGAAAAQYGYTPIMMPQIFRYKLARPATSLGSWVMNHWTRYLTEGWNRVVYGKPGDSIHSNRRIPMSMRVGILINFLMSQAFLRALGYTSSTILGTKLAIGPAGKMMWGLGQYVNNARSTHYKDRIKAKEGLEMFVDNIGLVFPGYQITKESPEFMEVLDGKRPWTDLVFYRRFTDENNTTPVIIFDRKTYEQPTTR